MNWAWICNIADDIVAKLASGKDVPSKSDVALQ
jgi:hypothetical protein